MAKKPDDNSRRTTKSGTETELFHVSSPTLTASEPEDNIIVMNDVIGLNCWVDGGERQVTVVKAVKWQGLLSGAGEVHQLAQSARKQREGQYEDHMFQLVTHYMTSGQHCVKVGTENVELLFGGKKYLKEKPKEEKEWAFNIRKCRLKTTKPDLQFYIVDAARSLNTQVGCVEIKSGNSPSLTTEGLHGAIQQAVCYAVSMQRPLMSKVENGVKIWRLPVLVVYENCGYWLSLTTDDALSFPYTLTICQFLFDDGERDNAAASLVIHYLQSLLNVGKYSLDQGFEPDYTQLLLPTNQLQFPAIHYSHIERSKYGNNIFRCKWSAFANEIEKESVLIFKNDLVTRMPKDTPVIIKIVSSTCYNTLRSALHIKSFLKELYSSLTSSASAGDYQVSELAKRITKLSLHSNNIQCNSDMLRLALSNAYDTYLYIGSRPKRLPDDHAGTMIVTQFRGEPLAYTDEVLKQLFNKANGADLRGQFCADVILPAFAAVDIDFCHFDIRLPNIVVDGRLGSSIRFYLIDWEEVTPTKGLLTRQNELKNKGGSWYPSINTVKGGLKAMANVFTACQLYLCIYTLHRVRLGESGSQIERGIRADAKFWSGAVHGDCFKILCEALSGSVIPSRDVLLNSLCQFLESCSCSS